MAAKQVSTMIKQGFISHSFLSPPPSSATTTPYASLSSPPPSFSDQTRPSPTRSNPTLFDMMSEEQSLRPPLENRWQRVQDRVSRVLADAPFQNPSYSSGIGDVKLTIVGDDDGFRVSMDMHRRVLIDRSRFFAETLRGSVLHSVEICDCDDVEVYVETMGKGMGVGVRKEEEEMISLGEEVRVRVFC